MTESCRPKYDENTTRNNNPHVPQYGADCYPQDHTECGHEELTQTAKNTKTPEHF